MMKYGHYSQLTLISEGWKEGILERFDIVASMTNLQNLIELELFFTSSRSNAHTIGRSNIYEHNGGDHSVRKENFSFPLAIELTGKKIRA